MPISSPAGTPEVFDRTLTRRRMERALAAGAPEFLIERAAEDLAERLGAIKRRFNHALAIGSHGAQVAAVLRGAGVGHVTRAGVARGADVDLLVDEEALPFADGAFDLIVSTLTLQAVNDLPGALAQIRRALRPDGLFIGCMLGGATLTELRQAFTQAETETSGGVSPRVAPFADVRDMGGLLQRAGLALPVADLETVTVRYGHPLRLMQELRALGMGNALMDRLRRPMRRNMLMRAAAIYIDRFASADGRAPATFEMVWMSGWAPHASQQKPLKPGSAKARLADALSAMRTDDEGR